MKVNQTKWNHNYVAISPPQSDQIPPTIMCENDLILIPGIFTLCLLLSVKILHICKEIHALWERLSEVDMINSSRLQFSNAENHNFKVIGLYISEQSNCGRVGMTKKSIWNYNSKLYKLNVII